jgi:hypothetical protein
VVYGAYSHTGLSGYAGNGGRAVPLLGENRQRGVQNLLAAVLFGESFSVFYDVFDCCLSSRSRLNFQSACYQGNAQLSMGPPFLDAYGQGGRHALPLSAGQ